MPRAKKALQDVNRKKEFLRLSEEDADPANYIGSQKGKSKVTGFRQDRKETSQKKFQGNYG